MMGTNIILSRSNLCHPCNNSGRFKGFALMSLVGFNLIVKIHLIYNLVSR